MQAPVALLQLLPSVLADPTTAPAARLHSPLSALTTLLMVPLLPSVVMDPTMAPAVRPQLPLSEATAPTVAPTSAVTLAVKDQQGDELLINIKGHPAAETHGCILRPIGFADA